MHLACDQRLEVEDNRKVCKKAQGRTEGLGCCISRLVKAESVLYETVFVSRSVGRRPLTLQQVARVADAKIIAHLRRACNYFAAGVGGTLDTVGVEGHTRLRRLRVNFSVAGMGRTIDVDPIEAVGFVHFYKVSESLGSESNSLLADGMGDAIVFAILRPGNCSPLQFHETSWQTLLFQIYHWWREGRMSSGQAGTK